MNNLYIGKICMIRTHSAGVHFGEIKSQEGKFVELKNSRRVYSWAGAASLSQLATEGTKKPDECKIAVKISELLLTEAVEIIPMDSKAIKSLSEVQEWKV